MTSRILPSSRLTLVLISVIFFITNNSCFLFTSYSTGSKPTWPMNYPTNYPMNIPMSNDINMMKQRLETLFGVSSNPFQTTRRYDLRGCQRIDNPIEIMNQMMSYNRQGYWTYCTQPDIHMHWVPYQTQMGSSSITSGISIPGSGPFSSSYGPQFLGKGRFDYLNGRRDVQLTCNLMVQGLRVIDKPIWQKIISTYDPLRTSYDCHPGSTTCTLSLITADGVRYTIENYDHTTYLRISNVQPNDYGTYRCSANAINKFGHTVPVYQIVDLLA